MSLSNSLKASILSYLYGPMSLNEFRSSTASQTLDAGESTDSEALRIANYLLGDFADLDLEHLSEQTFKHNLQNLLFSPSVSPYVELQFEPFSQKMIPIPSTGTLSSVETDLFGLAGTGRAKVYA